ncbi:hypothetical protein Adeg_0730 [Ammonifex degensii KC4]|uniref:Uncharacterized protein n=1 Tax=Ammonifex degensii (strain DSM 10501 / KC4) TaxID=429009 RepID=C9RC99_AMMDK|nr:hypothetical protein [Ammonifex degensii]ACX51876.1 hypothetical protein Adeg_0730 [Ammonifex degensii KC4]
MGPLVGALFFVLGIALAASLPLLTRWAEARQARSRWDRKRKGAPAPSGKTAAKAKAPDIFNLWEVEDVRDGLVRLTRNRWRMVLKLSPVNFSLLDEDGQLVVENALMSALMALDHPVEFVCTTEVVDTRRAVADLAAAKSRETDPVRARYASVLLSFLDELMTRRSALVKRSYCVLGYEAEDPAKARGVLEHRAALLSSALSRARVVATPLDTSELVDLLHHFMNRGRLPRPSDMAEAGALDLVISGRGVRVGGTPVEKEAGGAGAGARPAGARAAEA